MLFLFEIANKSLLYTALRKALVIFLRADLLLGSLPVMTPTMYAETHEQKDFMLAMLPPKQMALPLFSHPNFQYVSAQPCSGSLTVVHKPPRRDIHLSLNSCSRILWQACASCLPCTVMRTMSAPMSAHLFTCSTVPATSRVSVVVIVCKDETIGSFSNAKDPPIKPCFLRQSLFP